jgi:hypothetical protein
MFRYPKRRYQRSVAAVARFGDIILNYLKMGQSIGTSGNWEAQSASPPEEIGLFVTSQDFPTTLKDSFRSRTNMLRVPPPKIHFRPRQISPILDIPEITSIQSLIPSFSSQLCERIYPEVNHGIGFLWGSGWLKRDLEGDFDFSGAGLEICLNLARLSISVGFRTTRIWWFPESRACESRWSHFKVNESGLPPQVSAISHRLLKFWEVIIKMLDRLWGEGEETARERRRICDERAKRL